MGRGYRILVRPLLRLMDSERAHRRTLRGLRWVSSNPVGRTMLRWMYSPASNLKVEMFGTSYKHPFGLAAGMDKNAEAIRGWPCLGLSFIEIGGVTMLSQDGNPRPRMFRANKAQALVNRMGFNNGGSEAVAVRLDRYFKRYGRPPIPLWVNLGKSKLTSLDDAPIDYATTMDRLWAYTDVFVINVSSPNTPHLRDLQNDDGLIRILAACHGVNKKQSEFTHTPLKPLLVKIAPDLTSDQLRHVVETSHKHGANGIVVCNTTVERPSTSIASEQRVFDQTGGLSGRPLAQRSTGMIREVRRMVGPDWPIVGVGGIDSADIAWQKILAGATLLQAYSGFVFEGPSLCKSIVKGLEQRLSDSGFSTIQEAVGKAVNEEGC